MKDLTQGSVTKHLLHMSAFMAVSMIVQTLYLLADLFWVRVDQGDEGEPLALEAAIAQKRASEIADADKDSRPRAVDAEATAQGGDEVGQVIADAGLADVAEVGEVLANLGVVDAERLADLTTRDLGGPFVQQAFDVPQVEAEAVDAGAGEPMFAAVRG